MPFDPDLRALLKAVKATSVTPADAIQRVRNKLAVSKQPSSGEHAPSDHPRACTTDQARADS